MLSMEDYSFYNLILEWVNSFPFKDLSRQVVNLKIDHYKNTSIQIYRKVHLQKLKIFRQKTFIFFIFLLKTYIVGTR